MCTPCDIRAICYDGLRCSCGEGYRETDKDASLLKDGFPGRKCFARPPCSISLPVPLCLPSCKFLAPFFAWHCTCKATHCRPPVIRCMFWSSKQFLVLGAVKREMCELDSLEAPQVIVSTKYETVIRKCEEDKCNSAKFTVHMPPSLATRAHNSAYS